LTFLPLILGVRRSSDAEKSLPQDRKQLRAQMEETLRRDDFTCRFCGFRATQYQRVVPWEGESPAFVTACNFCEQCLTLDRAGLSGAGILIWLPEISQAELHHVVRAAYIARVSDNELAAAATRALDGLAARRADAKKRLGSDDPLLLATVMHEMLDDREYSRAGSKLDGIRLLPLNKHMVRGGKGALVDQFPQIVKYWGSPAGPYGHLPVEGWAELFKAAPESAGHA
jgi:intracellular multiplication protein IcmJ